MFDLRKADITYTTIFIVIANYNDEASNKYYPER